LHNVNARYPRLAPVAVEAIVDATFQVAAQRLSGALTTEETARLRDQVARTLNAAERLHAYPLANGDEPAFVLDLPGSPL
jgi:hypothetical protein